MTTHQLIEWIEKDCIIIQSDLAFVNLDYDDLQKIIAHLKGQDKEIESQNRIIQYLFRYCVQELTIADRETLITEKERKIIDTLFSEYKARNI